MFIKITRVDENSQESISLLNTKYITYIKDNYNNNRDNVNSNIHIDRYRIPAKETVEELYEKIKLGEEICTE